MKKYYLIGITLLFSISVFCQFPVWQWANSAGGSGGTFGNSIARDEDGNLYVTGSFQESVHFGVTYLTSSGYEDIFVAKMDSQGNWIWARSAGGVGNDVGYSITTDNAGFIYVTGHCYSSVNFGSINLSCNDQDVFIAKLDPNGIWQNVINVGGNSIDIGYSISVDNSGNKYVAGYFTNSVVFGTDSITSIGEGDIFVSKLDTDGNWLWGKRAGGTLHDNLYSFSIDSANSLYLTGSFQGNADFGSTSLASSGLNDVFVAKLDTYGNWLWAKKAGGIYDCYGFSISVDNSGNAYVTGEFIGPAEFGSISLNSTVNSQYYSDIFVAKLNSSGNWLWARKAGGVVSDMGNAIVVDNIGYSYITGSFQDIGLFGSHVLTSTTYDQTDIFVAKMDSDGNWLWAVRAGGSGYDRGNSICIDNSSNQYITGRYAGIALFDMIPVVISGNTDAFVAKLSDEIVSNDDNITTVGEVAIVSNYPNPFRAETKISYQVKEFNRVMIKIYNTKGQLINTLLNETKTSGFHDIIWQGDDSQGREVPAGVYFYQVNIGQTKFIKKAVVLK